MNEILEGMKKNAERTLVSCRTVEPLSASDINRCENARNVLRLIEALEAVDDWAGIGNIISARELNEKLELILKGGQP